MPSGGGGESPTTAQPQPTPPADLPLYPGSAPAQRAGGSSAIAAWAVEADPPAVYEFYVRELPAAGYRIDGAAPGGDAAVIRFSAPDGTAYQLDLTGHEPVQIVLGAAA